MREPLVAPEFFCLLEKVMLVVDLRFYGRSLRSSSVDLSVRSILSAAQNPNTFVAFAALNGEAGGNEETVLLAARGCDDDHLLDRSADSDERAMENLDEYRRLELFLGSRHGFFLQNGVRKFESESQPSLRTAAGHAMCVFFLQFIVL